MVQHTERMKVIIISDVIDKINKIENVYYQKDKCGPQIWAFRKKKPGIFDYEKYEKINKCNNQKSIVDNITGPEKKNNL